jgi:hypothetical protein
VDILPLEPIALRVSRLEGPEALAEVRIKFFVETIFIPY